MLNKLVEKYTYNGFDYIKDYKDEQNNVLIKHNKEIPEFLSKYYSVTQFSVDALKNNYLYASHPFELNDVYDCSSFLWITSENISFTQYKKFFDPYRYNEKELKEIYGDDKEKNFQFYGSESWVRLSNLFGVISLTPNKNCPLMWPHYTQEKGFQLRFKTNNLIQGIEEENEEGVFKGLNPINYSDELSAINLNKFHQPFIPAYYMMNIKDSRWSYENEWRIIISRPNMGIPFSKGGWLIREDYKTDKKNRYAYYGNDKVLDITVGNSFFNTRDFEIVRINDMKIKVEVIEDLWNADNQRALLDYIESNLSDKFYQIGVKYDKSEKAEFCLTRTRERIEIKKLSEDKFEISRTGEFAPH